MAIDRHEELDSHAAECALVTVVWVLSHMPVSSMKKTVVLFLQVDEGDGSARRLSGRAMHSIGGCSAGKAWRPGDGEPQREVTRGASPTRMAPCFHQNVVCVSARVLYATFTDTS